MDQHPKSQSLHTDVYPSITEQDAWQQTATSLAEQQNSHRPLSSSLGYSQFGSYQDLTSGAGVDVQDLSDLLSKLNPLAQEFVPPSHDPGMGEPQQEENAKQKRPSRPKTRRAGGNSNNSGSSREGSANGIRGNGSSSENGRGKSTRFPRKGKAAQKAQREENIRRTVYVCDIDQQVTEEQLANLFTGCGDVVDCRICGDPNSAMRFAFVEFTSEDDATKAVELNNTVLGQYPLRVLPSKTAIVPVNITYLPRTEEEREQCSRTVYVANIDKKVERDDVKMFFESLCGKVSKLRLLGDQKHSTRIAFVEFMAAESAMAALNCSGALLGSLPIRVSPSKTPVRQASQ